MVTAGRGRTCTRAGLFGGFTDRLFYLGFVGLGDGFVQAELLQHVLGVEQLGEGLVGDDVELVDLPHTRIPAERQPQPAPHRLLSEHLRSHRPQRHDDRDVLDIPAFLELVHAHHRQHRRFGPIQFVEATLGQLILVLGVHLQHSLISAEGLRGAQQLGDLGGVLHIGADHESDRVHMIAVLGSRVRVVVGLLERTQLQRVTQLLLFGGFIGAISSLAERQHGGLHILVLDGAVERVLENDVIGGLVHRRGQPDRRCWIEFLQRCIERDRAGPVQVGFVGDHNQIIEVLQVVEEHAGVLIEPAGLTAHRVLGTTVGVTLGFLRRDELLNVEDKRQHWHFTAERESGRAVLPGDPRRVVLWGHHLGRHRRAGDVAGRAGREVLHRLRLHRLAWGDDHDVANSLAAQILHKRRHQVGLAHARSEVEHLHHGRVIVTVESEDQLAQCFLVRSTQVELGTDRLQHVGVKTDVEPVRHHWSPPSLYRNISSGNATTRDPFTSLRRCWRTPSITVVAASTIVSPGWIWEASQSTISVVATPSTTFNKALPRRASKT